MSAIKLELTDIIAEVYVGDAEKDWCFVKIHFIGLDMFINSFKVMQSKKNLGYAVYPPSHFQKGKGYTQTVDLVNRTPLQRIIEERALMAAREWFKKERATTKYTVNNEDFDGKLRPKPNYF